MEIRKLTLKEEYDLLSVLTKISEDAVIGHGAARLVYSNDADDCDDLTEALVKLGFNPDDVVVKVGIDEAGINQSKNEVEFYQDHGSDGYLARIYAAGTYVEIMEKVEPIDGCFREVISDSVSGNDEYIYTEDIYNGVNGCYRDEWNYDEMYSFQLCKEVLHVFCELCEYCGRTSDNAQLGWSNRTHLVAYDYGYNSNDSDEITYCSDCTRDAYYDKEERQKWFDEYLNDLAVKMAEEKKQTRIVITPDPEFMMEVRKALAANDGYCPCKIDHIPENKCMCQEFRNQSEGTCHCGLYIKEKI